MAATLTESTPARKVWNGQYQPHNRPGVVLEGPVEALPYPDHFDPAEAAEAIFTDGCAICPGVLNAQEVAEYKAVIDSSGGPDEQYDHTKTGWCFSKLLTPELNREAHYLRYLDRPGVIETAQYVLGENCRVGTLATWVTGPGRKMPIHCDGVPVPLPEEILADPRVRIPLNSLVVQVYLNDMTPEIGPTLVIPGSHRAGRGPDGEGEWNGIKPRAAMVKAGDALLFRFDCWHGALSNTSKDQRRYIMQLVYNRADREVSYPSMKYEYYWDPEVIRQATPRQKQLLGAKPEPKSGT